MSRTNELKDIIRDALLSTSDDVSVSAESIAAMAISRLDPKDKAPALVAWGCVLELRQLAREMLRRTYEPHEENEPEQLTIFTGDLQDRYPGVGSHKGLYVPRLQMSYSDRMYNIKRLRKEADAKLKHADALEAETMAMQDAGFFAEYA